MWGRKDDQDSNPAPSAPAPRRPAAAPPTAAAAPAPSPSSAGRGQAVIGKSLKVKGTVSGTEDLYVDGEVEGTIELTANSLTIGPNGNVDAEIHARNITIEGKVTGDVKAEDRIDIRKTGSLHGDLTTARIAIEDGAEFRGSIDILKPEPVAAPSPPPKAATPPAPAKPAEAAKPETSTASAGAPVKK